MSNNKLDAPIEVLGLSRRAYNALKYRMSADAGVFALVPDPVSTVRQAAKLTERELNTLPSLGPVSKRELKTKLMAFVNARPLSLNETVKTQRGYGEVVHVSAGQACLRFPDGRLAVYLVTSLKRPDGSLIIE
ncbi:hypothetical protein ATDW_25950 [Asticcacaulis sp. DW145]|uniref:hypothetical protein n=1 Tax=Asticcacaulis sp. DW145 TaxID=3095608 RepID=UPI0030933D9F|nr:hypothetical protein ATDW_25950 [Asticcacaulis sp. DW145]